jgi:transcriptional regulator with XRE-family HTH domain
MPVEIDLDQLPSFPKRIPEKLRAIRERLKLTQEEIARRVGARNAAEIAAYENDEDDLLVSVLVGYAKIANVPFANIIDDDRDLWFGHRVN